MGLVTVLCIFLTAHKVPKCPQPLPCRVVSAHPFGAGVPLWKVGVLMPTGRSLEEEGCLVGETQPVWAEADGASSGPQALGGSPRHTRTPRLPSLWPHRSGRQRLRSGGKRSPVRFVAGQVAPVSQQVDKDLSRAIPAPILLPLPHGALGKVRWSRGSTPGGLQPWGRGPSQARCALAKVFLPDPAPELRPPGPPSTLASPHPSPARLSDSGPGTSLVWGGGTLLPSLWATWHHGRPVARQQAGQASWVLQLGLGQQPQPQSCVCGL